jgi:hypothetical protein
VEESIMSDVIHLTTKVLEGHRIEVSDPNLKEGESVEVVLYPGVPDRSSSPSVLAIVESLKGHRLFSTPQDVDQYLQEERNAWDK